MMNPKDKMIQLQKQIHEITLEHWLDEVFLSFHWWIIIIVTIGWIIIWWKLVDRKRLTEVLLYGAFIALLSTFADVFGWNFGLWSYHNKLIPICTPLIPIDLIIIPMTYMLIYQYYTSWSSFLVANSIVAVVFAFIGENILEWMEFYQPLKWKHIYSVPGYLGMAVLFKWLMIQVKQIQTN
ncbi:CBO0543 family protein [Ammoniphilus sp. 3BR4]|uniref:CBO0543 family protein n=1 Tax=Ammoniphilus sp. 3BR4 TaxID=3158265 RepID=UPI003467437C